ncbi:LacI family DNA-binding transcriptional regulator [Leadbettera azotonutricia]|uniref:Regulatory protein LacI n=1 Tax=Leadbettera azotonutricia (strain ATCC BAA-888 / DSM 13862 / ZAS-9) TaxID=545695 RepID=F5Y9Y7_LEAAZ|nr:LacI family DNA-binding transcriptional regulator [Leadbettera azotonutricia]AEF80225.1 regulatory protein LacI [Leadbettera azotonutricia ZAS-9]
MSPRIADIAKEAGVSLSTVSFALNNKPGVSVEVREKILTIAAKMGYKRILTENYLINDAIRIKFLKVAKHGHTVNEQHNAFIAEYMEGIEAGAEKRRYKVEVSFSNKVPIQDMVNAQKDLEVDGFIVLGTELNAHELNYFSAIYKPLVFIDTYFPKAVYDCIDIDNFDGVFSAIQYLYDNGHRSIGFINSTYETRNTKMRELGFLEAMDYFSLPVQEKFIISVDSTTDGSTRDISKYLKRFRKLPTAFFCFNDIAAYGCMAALKSLNYRVPQEISVIGFDDLPSSKLSDPSLTTIRVAAHHIGSRAVEKLALRMAGITEDPPENILIAGKLIPRNSVRKI